MTINLYVNSNTFQVTRQPYLEPYFRQHTVEQRVLNRREHLHNEVSPHLFLCC
jgi:hypothetical protein